MNQLLDLISERLGFAWYRSRHLRDGTWRHGARDAQQVILATKQYIRNDLAKHLEVPRGTPITIKLPSKGLTNMLWLARLGGTRAVVNCYLVHDWPRMEQHVTALKLLQDNDVRAPRLLHELAKPKKYGAYFVASEFVEGISRAGKEQQFSEKELKCVAQQLARMHRIKNDAWGRLCLPRKSDYFGRQMRLVQRYVERATKAGIASTDQRNKLTAWFQNWGSRFSTPVDYSLVHGDLHPNNILFEADGNCCFLDTDRVAWNLSMSDVATVHDRVCRRDEKRMRLFDEEYLANLPEADRARHLELSPYFEALYRLRAVTRELDSKVDKDNIPHADQWNALLQTCGCQSLTTNS